MKFKKILVPVDFSHFSKKALHAAIELATRFNAKILLLHVEEDVFHIKQIHKIHPPLENICEQFHKDFVVEKKKQLEKFKKYIPKRLFAAAIIKEGHPFVEIIKHARTHAVDLIVLSSRGRGDIKHTLLGSTADKVSRKAECPVLIVKDKKSKFVAP